MAKKSLGAYHWRSTKFLSAVFIFVAGSPLLLLPIERLLKCAVQLSHAQNTRLIPGVVKLIYFYE